MQITFKLQGEAIAAPQPAPAPDGIKPAQQQSFSLVRKRGATLPTQSLTVDESDAVCVELSDGFTWWMSAAEAAERFSSNGGSGSRAGSSGSNQRNNPLNNSEELECVFDPTTALLDMQSSKHNNKKRGISDAIKLSIKSITSYQFDFVNQSAFSIASWAETQPLDQQQPGLKHLDLTTENAGFRQITPLEIEQLATPDQALLVFIHGTASSTTGSFGELWHSTIDSANFIGEKNEQRQSAAQTLARKYGKRCLAFEYASITKSPIKNTLDLARALPANAQLHLVSHSQGGLLGELLCCAELESENEAAWQNILQQSAIFFAQDHTGAESWGLAKLEGDNQAAYQQEWGYLTELWQVLREKKFRISRFVRVACPAMGTTLASGKLDRWLSLLKFSASLVNSGGWGDYLISTICAIIKQRTDPRCLPGVEAMMPGSALVRFLNQEHLRAKADLTVIAGNLDDRSMLGWLKMLVTRQFFESNHDLVVNTGSMYGGLRRVSRQARMLFDSGNSVNHFSYFKNERSVKALLQALFFADQHLSEQSTFSLLQEDQRLAPARSAMNGAIHNANSATNLPLALLLPGVMGSQLGIQLGTDKQKIWLEILPLMQGGLAHIGIEAKQVQALGLLDGVYDEFSTFLSRSHQVQHFPYDWRLSVSYNADLLAKELKQLLPKLLESKRELRILGHSMGGLVVRAMLAQHPDLWQSLQQIKGFRFIMFGTPNFGSFQAVLMQLGRHQVLNWLALADLKNDKNALQAIISRFQGCIELLPTAIEPLDFLQVASWQKLHAFAGDGWQIPDEADLAHARATRKTLLNAPVDPKTMIYVAGWASETPVEMALDEKTGFFGDTQRQIRFYSTRRGDGTVAWQNGLLPGVPTYYVEQAEHDRLLSVAEVFPAYLELLSTGSTRLLHTEEPFAARAADGVEERREMQIEFPQYLPNLSNFGGFGGAQRRAREDLTLRKIQQLGPVNITIRHGDLAYARHPVCVGHYLGDTMVSAERQLDEKLKGELSERARLGIYPGALGTWAVFIANQAENRPGGAIVVGLGEVGELTPGNLQAGLTSALAEYTLQVANWHDERFGSENTVRHAAISFLLVGTGAGGVSAQDCISALLHSIKSVNDKLCANAPAPRSFINDVEILELFYDVALQATSALQRALGEPELQSYFSWQPCELVSTDTGRFRSQYDADASWWQRTEITFDKKRQELRFVAVTKRARAEQALVAGQMRLAKNFVRQAIGTTSNETDISRTLFEMLLPNRLKEASPDRQDMVLLLDEEAAQFPWEMLQDRWSASDLPPAVAAGMIRQLKTAKFRANVQNATGNNVLVVGNPQACSIAGQALIELPGARHEAQHVVKVLQQYGYDVCEEIDANAEQILVALHGAQYRILHLAGHGVHQLAVQIADDIASEDETNFAAQKARETVNISGMVIGADAYLCAADIEQMRWVPEVVFINCCHLASLQGTATHHNELAANLGAQFIRMGVKAVVAAGWEVVDDAASAFAQCFYAAMLAGEGFGRAVKKAREHVFHAFKDVNTWGAYQCYGDPDFRLVQNTTIAHHSKIAPYFSHHELVVDLNGLKQKAHFGQVGKEHLSKLLQRIPAGSYDKWLGNGAVLGALAMVEGELAMFKEALAHFDSAVSLKDAQISMSMLENRANFKARYAAQLLKEQAEQTEPIEHDKPDIETLARQYFDQAEKELTTLLSIAPNNERHYLLASLWKRKACWLPSERKSAFNKMRTQYATALEFADGDDLAISYAKLNRALASVLASKSAAFNSKELKANQLSADELASIVQQCDEIYLTEKSANRDAQDFWSASAMPQCKLVSALAQGTLPQRYELIAKLFTQAKQPGASKRQLASVLDNLQFIIAMLNDNQACQTEVDLLLRLVEVVAGA